jgi:alkaline phosphatase D
MKPAPVSRRRFVVKSSAALGGSIVAAELPLRSAEAASAHQAMGTRTGDVTSNSAIVWTRLTQHPVRNNEGIVLSGRAVDLKKGKQLPTTTAPVEQLEGACPGMPGRVRLRYAPNADLRDAKVTDWFEVNADGDFIHQFKLSNLQPGTTYHYLSETTDVTGKAQHEPARGKFQTAPAPDAPGNFRFCVMTCQGYPDRGHPDGHAIYPAMLALNPAFTSLTGDLVYYDSNAPKATSPELARYHWQRMFSLPRLVAFNSNVSTYWLKDDHDTLTNDSWPGMKVGTFTFDEGRRIFRQQAPMSDGPAYRTFRWGRDLQIWLTDGRDFRSPNTTPDGPEKTIWGAEQKAWFKRTVKESNATWKVLISPTPLVGPDRPTGKNDNHSNVGFQHEGDEIRAWLKANVPDNFFVICGDRHWQYHSIHPQTGLNEFSVGAASDEHAGGSPGETPAYHQFHRVKGGFLSVQLQSKEGKSTILFEHRDANGKVVYRFSRDARV